MAATPARRPLPAKLSPPRLRAVHRRPRLFTLLDRAARRPVGWIEGPAGAGKTTLAASWLSARGRRALWYQLDARDRDPATFFYFLREAVAHLAPRRREPLPLLTPEYLLGLPTYARNFFERAFARLDPSTVLVLDDFQNLPPDAALRRLLPEVLAAIPEGVHVLILSRAGPPAEFARLRAHGQLATVGWDELRFTLRESAALLAEHGHARLSGEALAALHRRTAGWAAGLVVMTEGARRGAPSPGAAPASAEIFDYFASEVFERADPAARRLLLCTALPPAVTPALAVALTGDAQAGAALEALHRHHYFTERHPGTPPVYRFHPLFREFLLARAAEELGEAACTALRRQAAGALLADGQAEEAVALLLEAGDFAGAGEQLVRLAPGLVAQGRSLTLEGWISALPAAAREADPRLDCWAGICRLPADPAGSLALLERAYQRLAEAGDDAGALLAWAGAVTAIHVSWRDLAQLDPWLARLDERLARGADFPSPEVELRVWAAVMIPLLWRAPAHPDIARRAARLRELLRGCQDPDLAVRGSVALAWYHQWCGSGPQLAALSEELERLVLTGRAVPPTRIGGLWFGAFVCDFSTSDPALSLARVKEAMALAEAEGVRIYDHLLHSQAVAAHLSQGDVAAAGRHLEQMRRSVSAAGNMSGHYHHLRAWRAVVAGDLDAALAHAERSQRVAEESGFVLAQAQCHYALGHLHHALGREVEARAHLAVATRAAAETHSTFLEFACLLLEAQLLLDAGDAAAALPALRCGLALGRERGFTNLPWWSAAQALPRVCAAALEAGVEVPYVRRLVRVHQLHPDPAWPCAPEGWPFALRIRAMGRFALQRDDRRGEPPGRGQTKPLLLLKALVALGAEEVPEERLLECLWPEAEGDRARQSLKFTVHALRKLLGRDDMLSAKMGRYGLDPRAIWLDVRELQRAGTAVERARRAGEPRALRESLDALVLLYRGPLLAAESAPWVLPARERLRGRFLRLVADGAGALAGHDPAAAAAACERALEVDPLAERIVQVLLRCHRALGQAAEGVAAYRRLAEALRREVGLSPSAATSALHRALLAG